MPYIEIRAYPKDEAIKRRVAERIEQVFLEEWGCAKGAINVSFEEIRPEDWDSNITFPTKVPYRKPLLSSDSRWKPRFPADS